MKTIDNFHGEHRFLSNFWLIPIEYEGLVYPTVEHAFQAAKTTQVGFREAIRGATCPGDAKLMGRQITLRSDWEAIKLDVMYSLLCIKFDNSALRKQLLETEDATLIEGNTWNDVFWGVCNGNGHNHLGKLLMRLRGEIAYGQHSQGT